MRLSSWTSINTGGEVRQSVLTTVPSKMRIIYILQLAYVTIVSIDVKCFWVFYYFL